MAGAHEILDVGVYGDLTVDALARALHMSKSTLYKYFASKEDVIVALVDAACATTDREVDVLEARGGAAREVLARVIDVLAAHVERLPRSVVLQESRLPEAARDRMQYTRARIGAALKDAAVRGHGAGEFTFPHPVLAAHGLMAGAEAAMITAARGDVPVTRAEAVRSMLKLVLPGMTPQPAAAA